MTIDYYPALLAPELAIPEPIGHDEEQRAGRSPLVKLAPGPWRSLGGYLDYTCWPERERFLELDLAIKSRQEGLWPLRADGRIPPPRRCRASILDGEHCSAIVTLSEHYDGWKCEAHRPRARGAGLAVSTAILQTPQDQAGPGWVAKAEPGALENLRLALLACNAMVA